MIFITGPHGSGKSRVAESLQAKGFPFLDMGPAIRALHRAECQPGVSLADWREQGRKRFGEVFPDYKLLEKAHAVLYGAGNIKVQDLVIVGERSYQSAQFLLQNVSANGWVKHRGLILYLDAPFEVLHGRYNLREGSPTTPEEFGKLLRRDEEIGLLELKTRADCVLPAHHDLPVVNGRVEAVLRENGYDI